MPNPTNYALLDPNVLDYPRWFNYLYTNFLVRAQGNLTLSPATDSTSAIMLTNAAGTTVVILDTVNSILNVPSLTIGPISSTTPSIATSGTINTAGLMFSKVTTAGAVTGVILQAGTQQGQPVIVVNTSANSITFAAVGTSNVADGVSDVIAANTSARYSWIGATWSRG